MTIPESKIENIRGKARDLLSQEGTMGRELANFIRTAFSMVLAKPPALPSTGLCRQPRTLLS